MVEVQVEWVTELVDARQLLPVHQMFLPVE
jgi:hypothetical protein